MNIIDNIIIEISIVCYLLAEAIKATKLNNKWIPLICIAMGSALSVAAYYIIPEFPADNVMTAMVLGASAGGAATGINQCYKQTKV